MQQRLADEAGITLHTVRRIEQGYPVYHELEVILKIAKALNISVDYLIGYSIVRDPLIEIEVGFNSQYLLDFLGVAHTDMVELQLNDDESAGQLQLSPRPDGYDYRYVIMPMRV